MVQTDSEWLRKLEFYSLLIAIIGWPLLWISLAILVWFFVLPASSNQFLAEFGSFFCLLFALSWNTRFSAGGLFFMDPLKNYLKHTETKDDRFNGQISSVISIMTIFFAVMLVYGIFHYHLL